MSDEVPRIDLVVDGDHPPTIDLEVVTGGLTEQGTQALIDASLDGFDPADGSNWTLTRDTGLELHHVKTTLIPDAETTIGTGWGWPAFPDITGGFLKGADGVVRHYSSGLPTAFEVGVTTVEGDDIYAAPRQSVTVTDYPAELEYCSGGPIVDLGGGVGMMILHLEWQPYSDTEPYYWTLAAGKVVDDGDTITITYLGEVITHELTEAEALAGPFPAGQGSGAFLIHDDTVYVYHYDYDDTGQFNPGVSRCSIADIATAVAADEAPVFNKWAGEALTDTWTTPGLGGDAYPNDVIPFPLAETGDFVTLPDGRHLWVGAYALAVGADWGVFYNLATDPVTWAWVNPNTTEDVILSTQDAVEYIYGTLWSGDPDNPKTAARPSVLFPFVASTDLSGRWGDYSVDQLELWPVVTPSDYEYVLDPAIQPDRIYTSGASTLDYATLAGPGTVYQYVAPSAHTLPALDTAVVVWEVLNGASDGAVTIEPASGDPTFNGGALSAIELLPGEVAHIVGFPDGNTWVTWTSSTGSRVVPSVFQARLYASFPIEFADVSVTISNRDLSMPFLSGVLDAGAKILLHNQTDPDDDGMYVALEDPLNPGFTDGSFEYAPEHLQPFRPHGVGLFVAAGVNFANGAPLQGVIFTTDGVTWTIEPFAYVPANGADWDDNPPTSLVAALDRIAAHLGPIP